MMVQFEWGLFCKKILCVCSEFWSFVHTQTVWVTENWAFAKILPGGEISETTIMFWRVDRENWVSVSQCGSVFLYLLCLTSQCELYLSCLDGTIFCNGWCMCTCGQTLSRIHCCCVHFFTSVLTKQQNKPLICSLYSERMFVVPVSLLVSWIMERGGWGPADSRRPPEEVPPLKFSAAEKYYTHTFVFSDQRLMENKQTNKQTIWQSVFKLCSSD